MNSKTIIEVSNLTKSFPNKKAVDNLSFSVREGEFFAFLGENGAGKSTTINMICTFLEPSSGTILIDGLTIGKDDDAIRKKIGVVFQDNLLDKRLTVYENLYLRGSMYGFSKEQLKARIEEVLAEIGITKLKNQYYGKLSGGQRRKCDIARAILHRPQILFLDEPTTGLDPASRKTIWEVIERMRIEKKMTIFLTTHYMEEVLKANFVTIIDEGKIKVQGTPASIREQYSHNRLIVSPLSQSSAGSSLAQFLAEQGIDAQEVGANWEIKVTHTKDALPLLQQLAPYIDSFEVIKGTMDDAFINITGKEIN